MGEAALHPKLPPLGRVPCPLCSLPVDAALGVHTSCKRNRAAATALRRRLKEKAEMEKDRAEQRAAREQRRAAE